MAHTEATLVSCKETMFPRILVTTRVLPEEALGHSNITMKIKVYQRFVNEDGNVKAKSMTIPAIEHQLPTKTIQNG